MMNFFANFLKNHVFGFIVLGWGLYSLVWRLFGSHFEFLPGDFGDTRFNIYVLENAYQFVFGKLDSLWNAGFMYPEPNVISFSDNLLGNVLIYAIPRFLDLDIYDSFQVWFLLICVLNFICAYYFLNIKFKFHQFGSAAAAFIFAFSLPVIGQFAHVQVFPRFMIPFIIYYLIQFLQSQESKYLKYFLIALIFQFYLGIYLGFLTALLAMFIAIVAFCFKPKFKNYLLLKNLIYLVSAVALLLPLMYPYYLQTLKTGVRSFGEVSIGIPQLRSYFLAPKGNWYDTILNMDITNFPAYWEHFLFPGFIPYLCILLSTVIIFRTKGLNKPILILLISLILTFIFTLKIGDFTLYHLIYKIPGFSALRALGRIIFVFLFLYAVFIAYVLDYFIKRKSFLIKSLLLVFSILAILEQYNYSTIGYYRFEKQMAKDRQANILNLVNSNYNPLIHKAFVFYDSLSLGNLDCKVHIDAMLVSQHLNIPTVNGYSGACPSTYVDFHFTYSKAKCEEWINYNFHNNSAICYIPVPKE